jgi:hypothetical protein
MSDSCWWSVTGDKCRSRWLVGFLLNARQRSYSSFLPCMPAFQPKRKAAAASPATCAVEEAGSRQAGLPPSEPTVLAHCSAGTEGTRGCFFFFANTRTVGIVKQVRGAGQRGKRNQNQLWLSWFCLPDLPLTCLHVLQSVCL